MPKQLTRAGGVPFGRTCKPPRRDVFLDRVTLPPSLDGSRVEIGGIF
ncbi:MAG TPA: hypothetical protein VMU33_08175 [Burkholderiaceae bacterium]|nr:hypothetical protein [Burkholderiaceae bacterium]